MTAKAECAGGVWEDYAPASLGKGGGPAAQADRNPRMAQFFFFLSALVSVTALAVCGCTQHHTPAYADPSAANFLLDALAKQIGSGLPVESDPLGLKVDAVPAADTVRLHCRLTNISHEPITLDRLKLPCVGWWSLTVLGVTTDGRVLPQSVGVGSFLGPADHRQLPFSRLRPLRLKWRCSPFTRSMPIRGMQTCYCFGIILTTGT